MRLHITDVSGRQTGGRKRGADHRLLCRSIRGRQTGTAAILVDRTATHHRQDAVAIGHGVRKPPKHQDGAAFAAHVAVRRRVECLAPAVRRHHPRLGEADVHFRREDEIDAAGKCQVAFAQTQALTGEMQRHERRRTRGIHRDAWPVQAEEIRQASRGNAVGVPAAGIGVDQVHLGQDRPAIIAVGDAQIDTRAGAGERGRRMTGILQGFPADLQQQALLRVHADGLARRDAKEVGIELIHALEECAVAGDHLAGCIGILGIEGVEGPTIRRNRANRVGSAPQQSGKTLSVRRAAREPKPHPDDRDRRRSCSLSSAQAAPADRGFRLKPA